MSDKNNKIREKLLCWYQENQRVLPWRGSEDPYKIWLSEVIMQQTRVAQGTPYYLKFIEKYPTVASLAAADEQEVLKLWQGLGYYSRGRNLLKAARQVVTDFGGAFPQDYKEIIKLKGVGPYTAAAIASIAFKKPNAVLDGNVFRVLSRIYSIETPINGPGSREIFQDYADKLLDKKNPGTFNEAMMELGATLCLPNNPACNDCPIMDHCIVKKNSNQNVLPVKLALNKVKTRYLHYLFVNTNAGFILRHRQPGDIWQGLYELPLVETNKEEILSREKASDKTGLNFSFMKPLKKMTHKLTHQRLEIMFYEADMSSEVRGENVLTDAIGYKHYPLPKPLELFLKDYLCTPVRMATVSRPGGLEIPEF